MHSRPDCWPSKLAKRCVDKQSGNLARKPQVCQRSVACLDEGRPILCAVNLLFRDRDQADHTDGDGFLILHRRKVQREGKFFVLDREGMLAFRAVRLQQR